MRYGVGALLHIPYIIFHQPIGGTTMKRIESITGGAILFSLVLVLSCSDRPSCCPKPTTGTVDWKITTISAITCSVFVHLETPDGKPADGGGLPCPQTGDCGLSLDDIPPGSYRTYVTVCDTNYYYTGLCDTVRVPNDTSNAALITVKPGYIFPIRMIIKPQP